MKDITSFFAESQFRHAISEIEQYARRQFNVKVTGTQGAGKSSILKHVASQLEAKGMKTVYVSAFTTTDRTSVLPFAFSNLNDSSDGRDLGVVAVFQRILKEAKAGKLVLFIDEADKLHDLTWGMIASAQSTQNFGVVAAFNRYHEIDEESPNVKNFHLTALTVEIPALTIESFVAYLDLISPIPVETETAMRIFAKASGNPGLTKLILEASISSGVLQEVAGRLVAHGPLWGPALTGVVEAHLQDLSGDQMENLKVLALQGLSTYQSALTIMSESELEVLVEREYVRLQKARGETWVTIDPPLIAEYFRQMYPVTDPESAGGEDYDSAPKTQEILIPDAVHFALVREHQQARERSLKEYWVRNPNAKNGLKYLKELIGTRGTSDEIEKVFETEFEFETDTAEYLDIRVNECLWTGLVLEEPDQALDMLQDLLRVERGTQNLDAAFRIRTAMLTLRSYKLEVSRPWIEENAFEQSFDPTQLNPREQESYASYLIACAEACTFRADSEHATKYLAHVPAQFRELTQFVVIEALVELGQGNGETAEGLLAKAFESASRDLAYSELLSVGWALTLTFYVQGKYRALVNFANVIEGSAPVPWFPNYGKFIIQALLIVSYLRVGNQERAQDLKNTQETIEQHRGIVNGEIFRSYTNFFFSLLQSDDSQAREKLWHLAQTQVERGNLLFGFQLLITATLDKVTPEQAKYLEDTATDMSFELYTIFAEVIAAKSAGNLMRVAEALEKAKGTNAAPVIISAFQNYLALLRMEGNGLEISSTEADHFAYRARAAKAGVDVTLVELVVEQLTAREEEVVRLLKAGLTNQKIAQKLSLSSGTVNNYVHKIMRKMGVHSRPELIAKTSHL